MITHSNFTALYIACSFDFFFSLFFLWGEGGGGINNLPCSFQQEILGNLKKKIVTVRGWGLDLKQQLS
jgi:hypothetical protein